MKRHRTPPTFLLLALVALPLLLLAGCGGSASSGTAATTGGPATTTATTTSAATATATKTRHARRSPALSRAQRAVLRATVRAQLYTRPRRRFLAAPISHAAASRLARSGAVVVPVAVGGPGTVSAFGQAQLPGQGVVRVAEAAPRTARAAGRVKLTLALTPEARARLAAGRGLLMYVAVRFSKGTVIERMPVRLAP
jgi:hypothetical protein